jgi:hypothetical protein
MSCHGVRLTLLSFMRATLMAIAGCVCLLSHSSLAQVDSSSRDRRTTPGRHIWIVPVAVGLSAAFDEEAREGAIGSHSRSLDRLAKIVNPFGTARRLVPTMGITYAGALISGNESLQRGTLATAAGYIAADLVESALKPAVGRERPHASGNSRRFHAFTANGDWHSFPSAHVAHITSIVEGISEQTNSFGVDAVGDLLISLVCWDRVYEDQHWTSDVTATVAISSFVSVVTVRWVRSHWKGH